MIKFCSGIYTKEIFLISFKIIFSLCWMEKISLFALLEVPWIEQDIGKKKKNNITKCSKELDQGRLQCATQDF